MRQRQVKQRVRVSKFTVIMMVTVFFMAIIVAADARGNECACDHVYNGSGRVDLFSGQTLCIQSGTFSQEVLSNDQNRQLSNITICIAEGATYQFSSNHKLFSFQNSKIVNHGTLKIDGGNIDKRGFIDNYGVIEAKNLNTKVGLELKNFGTWIDKNNLVLEGQSLVVNEGFISVNSNLNSNNETSFINNGRVVVTGNFNPNGEFVNNGPLIAGKFININSQAVLTNQCFLYATQGFNNNSPHTQNLGLIQTGANKLVQLNQKYWQNSNGTLRGGSLINNAIVSGDGYYYFTGNTVNHSQFGSVSSNIQFYDETKTGVIFDNDQPKQLSSALISSTNYFQPMDTIAVKQTICPGAPSILPVELISFTASRQGMLVNVSWATVSELNSDYFIVERSYDGIHFEEIGRLSASGTTSVPQSYGYTDDESVNSLESIAYYRLRQVDFDGRSETFKIVSVDLSEVYGFSGKRFEFYPNPTRDLITVPGSEGVLKQVFSLAGNLVTSTRETVVDISNFVSGLYLLKIGNLGEIVEKVLKL